MDRRRRLRAVAKDHLPTSVLARLRAARDAYRAARRAYGSARQQRPTSAQMPRTAAAGEESARQVQARFFVRLSQGAPLESAAADVTRELVETDGVTAAMSFADALAARPETATAGHLATGIVAVHRKLPELAAAEFEQVPPGIWRRHAPGEFLDAAYRTGPEDAVAAIRQLVADQPDIVDEHGWFEAVKYAFVAGDLPLAREAYALLVRRAGAQPSDWAASEIAWLEPWMSRERAATAPSAPSGQVSFALIDYRQPGRAKASQNIGDYVQTLASLGHLVRHRNVRLHGLDKLAEFARDMQQRVRPERVLDTPAADVTLCTVDRDASNYEAFPDGTWMLAFGWYMHPLFGVRHDFPLHPNLRPILVSFHCNKRELLTEDAVAYLRRYGPVGCRDWTTADLLLSLDVPAFFSGCLTTTVDTVFPDAEPASRKATVYVDMPQGTVPAGADTAKHSYGAVKRRGFVRNLRDAVDLLERYRTDYTDVVTSRLHCYLPARALGLNVDFRPKNRADVRFNGLIDIDDATFAGMRSDLLARLEPVLTAILAGRPESDVYRIWREVNAADVTAAQARHAAVPPLPPASLDVAKVVRKIHASAVDVGPTDSEGLDLAVPVTDEDVQRLPHTLGSLLAKASRPVRLTLLAWGCGPDEHRVIGDALPELAVRWLPCDGLTRDTAVLLLPELLAQVDRVSLLPPAAVVLGDVAELASWDLAGRPLAARTALGTTASSGFGRLYRAARRLHPDAAAAHELFLRIHARHAFDFDAFDTDVMVLDLARMRSDDLTRRCLPYLERFGFSAAEALMLFAGPDRAELPPEWAHVPASERVAEPLLVHWPGAAKPWQRRYAAGRELWERTAPPDRR